MELHAVGSRVFLCGRTDGLRDGHDEAVRNFVNAPEVISRY